MSEYSRCRLQIADCGMQIAECRLRNGIGCEIVRLCSDISRTPTKLREGPKKNKRARAGWTEGRASMFAAVRLSPDFPDSPTPSQYGGMALFGPS